MIVGGAILGSCVAYFLRELGFRGTIVVLERDPTYQYSSTARSVASIRTQFGCAVNVAMSLFGAEFLRSIGQRLGVAVDVGLVERGYLIIGNAATATARRSAARAQNQLGADVEVLSRGEIRQRFPWLNVEDVSLATYGRRNEGWFDAWSLLQAMRQEAIKRGVEFRRGDVTQICARGDRAISARLQDGTELAADWFVNTAGALSGDLVRDMAIALPIVPRKRTVFRLKAPLSVADFPMLFDDSGAWIRPEGLAFIAGIAPAAESDPDAHGDFEPQWELFESVLWPALAHRVPALEEVRLESAWAGHYELNTLDHNAVIGPHDRVRNLLFATGFSGHGVMHAPAAGRGVAEQIVHGAYQSLDLSPLGYERIRRRLPLPETIIY